MKCFSVNYNFWRLFLTAYKLLRGGHLFSQWPLLSGWQCSTNQVQLGAEDSLVQVLSHDTISGPIIAFTSNPSFSTEIISIHRF